MTSQRWTRIRPPISPFPYHLHPTFSPGRQQTECQVALPALPKVLPLIPLPPSTLLTNRHKHTHNALLLMQTIFHQLNPLSIFSQKKWFIPVVVSDPKKSNSLLLPPHVLIRHFLAVLPGHPWQPFFDIAVNDSAGAAEGRHVLYMLCARVQMKWPFPVIACTGHVSFHSTGTINAALPQLVQ